MIPVYAFVEGDTLGLLVLAREHETVADLTERIQRAASLRVAPSPHASLRHDGRVLDPWRRVDQAGVGLLDRVDLTRG